MAVVRIAQPRGFRHQLGQGSNGPALDLLAGRVSQIPDLRQWMLRSPNSPGTSRDGALQQEMSPQRGGGCNVRRGEPEKWSEWLGHPLTSNKSSSIRLGLGCSATVLTFC